MILDLIKHPPLPFNYINARIGSKKIKLNGRKRLLYSIGYAVCTLNCSFRYK
jgi:hypothetical protein